MYKEDKYAALPYRRRLVSETDAFIESLRLECDKRRADRFNCDYSSIEAYEHSISPNREALVRMLGLPLSAVAEIPFPNRYESVHLDDDEYGSVDRIHVEVAPGLYSYGLLFTPDGDGKYPLTVALHGGLGTPEIVSSFYDSGNYNNMVRRLRQKCRTAVYVPQLMLWGEYYDEEKGDNSDHLGRDIKLKQVGGSLAALEVFKLMRTVDHLTDRLKVDSERIGIIGLSYGGFYTLLTAALDRRFKVALSSCFFNERYRHCWGDWSWFDSASLALDAELAALICPRELIIQVGETDHLFDPSCAEREFKRARGFYDKLGIPDKISFTVRAGGHQFSPEDGELDRFVERLLG